MDQFNDLMHADSLEEFEFDVRDDLFNPEVERKRIPQFSNDELDTLTRKIIENDKITDATFVVTELFSQFMSNLKTSLIEENFDILYKTREIARTIRMVNKFNEAQFARMLHKNHSDIPLELVWWLHKYEILLFREYCMKQRPENLDLFLLKHLKDNTQNCVYTSDNIVKDFILELLTGWFADKLIRIRNKDWHLYCQSIFAKLIDKITNCIIQEEDDHVSKIVRFTHELGISLPKRLIVQVFKYILNKLMSENTKEFDLYETYTAQVLWTSKKMPKVLRNVYFHLFRKYLGIADIIERIEECYYDVNWKFTLSAISVWSKVNKELTSTIHDLTDRFFKESFKNGDSKKVIVGLLIIRQYSLELGMIKYAQWFDGTLGRNSSNRIAKTKTTFQFIIETFNKLIPYESICFLRVHTTHFLKYPTAVQSSLSSNFRALSKSRLNELQKYPIVKIMKKKVSVLHMLEQTIEKKKINYLLHLLVINQHSVFMSIVMPILKKETKFTEIITMLEQKNYIENDSMEIDPFL